MDSMAPVQVDVRSVERVVEFLNITSNCETVTSIERQRIIKCVQAVVAVFVHEPEMAYEFFHIMIGKERSGYASGICLLAEGLLNDYDLDSIVQSIKNEVPL